MEPETPTEPLSGDPVSVALEWGVSSHATRVYPTTNDATMTVTSQLTNGVAEFLEGQSGVAKLTFDPNFTGTDLFEFSVVRADEQVNVVVTIDLDITGREANQAVFNHVNGFTFDGTHNVFQTIEKAGGVPTLANYADNWTNNIDLTGLSFANWGGALISEDILIEASHTINDPDVVAFIAQNGTIQTRNVVDIRNVGNDIQVSKLDQPVTNAKVYPLLSSTVDPLGVTAIAPNQVDEAGMFVIHPHVETSLLFIADTRSVNFNTITPVGGDSGRSLIIPSAVGEVLCSFFTAPIGGPNLGSTDNQTAIATAITEMNGQQFTTSII